MLKISERKTARQTVTLKLEGRIVGPWVAELQQACEPLANSDRLTLDLTDVSSLAPEALVLLAKLRSRGTTLLNPTPFVAEQLKRATKTAP